jgi:hypothetical protein
VTPTIPRQFTAFLQPTGGSRTRPPRADLEAFIANLLDRWLPATAATRYKQLQALYRWLEDEEETASLPRHHGGAATVFFPRGNGWSNDLSV